MTKWIGDRVSFEDNAGATTIVINPLRVWWKEVLLTIWVAGFSFVGLVMIYMLLTGFSSLNYDGAATENQVDNQIIYSIVFLGFWAYFEYKTLKALLWYRFGKELILIDNDGFSLKKSILSYGRARRYFFENMKDFHQRKDEPTSFGNFFENAYWALGTDALAFTHNGKGKTFARRMDEKTGKLLLNLIDDRVKKRIKKRK
ncbi:MAG: hypothetical protein ACI8ZM_001938 [Crocinitomix sp.]|jgi:hypothetical protein